MFKIIKMEKNQKIYTLITALAVVLALMGVIFVMSQTGIGNQIVIEKKSNTINYLEISNDVVELSKKTNIVTPSYVRSLDENANLIIMTEDGSFYAVQSGNFLVDGRLVTINEAGKNVYYVNDPKKSVSSN